MENESSSAKKRPMSGAEWVKKFRLKKKDDLVFKTNDSTRVENLRKSRVAKMSNQEKQKYPKAMAEKK